MQAMIHKMINTMEPSEPPSGMGGGPSRSEGGEGLFPEEKVRAKRRRRNEAKRSGANSIWSILLYKAEMDKHEI